MVTKVIGKADGIQINFIKSEGDIWQVIVPTDMDGEYVVDIQAFDDAGNIAYCTKYLLIVNVNDLVCRILPTMYYSEYLGQHYTSSLLTDIRSQKI